MAAKLH